MEKEIIITVCDRCGGTINTDNKEETYLCSECNLLFCTNCLLCNTEETTDFAYYGYGEHRTKDIEIYRCPSCFKKYWEGREVSASEWFHKDRHLRDFTIEDAKSILYNISKAERQLKRLDKVKELKK